MKVFEFFESLLFLKMLCFVVFSCICAQVIESSFLVRKSAHSKVFGVFFWFLGLPLKLCSCCSTEVDEQENKIWSFATKKVCLKLFPKYLMRSLSVISSLSC